jgi:TetR/AcrR family transcriptional repressor of nem operon
MLTSKGRATRDRIVRAASVLMYERGVAGTSTEDVRAAADVSASQIYHYFADKRSLTSAVIEFWSHAVLGFQKPMLAQLDDVDGLRAWADTIVNIQRANDFRGGCPLGSLASELSDGDADARDALAASYRSWGAAIRGGLAAMRERGELVAEADVDTLATTLLTALQGGLLLTKTLRDAQPLDTALHTVIDHIATFCAPREPQRSRTISGS